LTRDELLGQQREETLSNCLDRLVDMRLDQSLAALHLIRQLNAGAKERDLLVAIFGKASTPVRNTRKAEYHEDTNEGGGEEPKSLCENFLQRRLVRKGGASRTI
jgi:hypothetical protein